MPELINAIMPALEPDDQKKAEHFWNNAYAYAMQAVPYANERITSLNQAGMEAVQQLMQLPEPEQAKMFQKIKEALIDPIEGDTAKEYNAAWQRLQVVTQGLHKMLVPSMPMLAQTGMAPQPPTEPPLGELQPQQMMMQGAM